MQDLKRRATAAMDAINSVTDEINLIIAEYNEMLAPITLTWWPGEDVEPECRPGVIMPFCIDGTFIIGWAMTPCKTKIQGRKWQLVVRPNLPNASAADPLTDASRYIRNCAIAQGIVDAVACEVVKYAEKVAAETVAAAEAVRELRGELQD